MAKMRPEGLYQLKIPMNPLKIETATFLLVEQCLNQRCHHGPPPPPVVSRMCNHITQSLKKRNLWNCITCIYLFSMAQQPLVDQDLTVEASRWHSDTSHSVGIFCTGDQSDAESSTWHTTLTRERHSCPWRDSNPQSQQKSGRRRTPWDGMATGIGTLHL
jgi:hypothetical protein